MIKQNFKNIKGQYLKNELFSKLTSSNIFLYWISRFKQNFKNFKRTTLEECKYPSLGPEGLLSFYQFSTQANGVSNQKIIWTENWYATLKNNETLCYKLKTCIFNSTKLYIRFAIFPLNHKVHGSTTPSPWWHELVPSDGLTQWLPRRLSFNISIICSTSSFCLSISFTLSSFSLLFFFFSDFCKSPFLLAWASFCISRAF